MMPQTQRSEESLLAEIAALRKEVSALQREKADMELVIEMTAEHSDGVAENLHQRIETTQRESAKQFELIINMAPAPIIVSRIEDDTIIYANQSASELTGASHADLMRSRLVEFYADAEDRKRLLAEVDAQRVINNWEIQGRGKDGVPFWAIAFVRPLVFHGEPCILEAYHNRTDQKRAEQERARLQQQVIDAQRQALRALSSPIIPVIDAAKTGGIIVIPLIGDIDSQRAQDLTRSLLAGITKYRAKVVILDITGVSVVDADVADHLSRTIQAARLKGARTIITGISDRVAETIIDLGIDWSRVQALGDLQAGLVVALDHLGLRLARA